MKEATYSKEELCLAVRVHYMNRCLKDSEPGRFVCLALIKLLSHKKVKDKHLEEVGDLIYEMPWLQTPLDEARASK